MKSFVASLRSLFLPYGLPRSQPQVIINIDPIPPELVAYYAANTPFATTETVINVPILAQKDQSNYEYISLNIDDAGEMYLCHGTRDSTNGVNETYRELVPFGFRTGIIYGALPNAGSITQVQYGIAQVTQTCAVIINRSSTYTIDGHSAPRGMVNAASRNTSTGALAAETNIISAANTPIANDRIYRVGFNVNSFGSVENVTIYRLYISGSLKDSSNKENPAGTVINMHDGAFYIGRTGGADSTETVTISAAPNAGTVTISFGGAISRMWIEDIGSYNDFGAALNVIAV